jgi:tetratricopeptide (TPR) repeat protein
MNNRRPRPYEQKQMSRAGAVIFAVGLLAMFVTITVIASFVLPGILRRVEYLPLYAQTYYHKLVPPPEYLPTPAPTVSGGGTTGQGSGEPPRLDIPPVATPVEVRLLPTPTIPANTTVGSATLPQPQPAALVELARVESDVQLQGFSHQWQTWNNCGPATVTMNMSYFGRPETQVEAAQFLKPNKNDKNVNPHELAAYARQTGLEAIVRQGGSIAQIKQFISNGLPVLAETWLIHDGDGLGHYRLITGYDDVTQQFTTFDSLNGPDFITSYEQFDADWRVFNRLYVVIYPPEQGTVVQNIIGPDLNDEVLYTRLVQEAQAEIEANPQDAIAHFNQGDAFTRLNRYDNAVIAFDQARQTGLHWRRLWYQFTPFEAYYNSGRYQDVLDLTTATIKGTGGLEEAYYYQGLALLATGQGGAAQAFESAIAYNNNFTAAREALNSMQAPE